MTQFDMPLEDTTLTNAVDTKQYEHKYAGFWIRFIAYIMDSLIVTAVVGITINPFFYLFDLSFNKDTMFAPLAILTAIVYYAYFVIMTWKFQQTLGKMIFGLKVIRIDGTKPTLVDLLFREWIGRFISNVIPLLYVLITFLPKHQALHDYFADTCVVHENVYVDKAKY